MYFSFVKKTIQHNNDYKYFENTNDFLGFYFEWAYFFLSLFNGEMKNSLAVQKNQYFDLIFTHIHWCALAL